MKISENNTINNELNFKHVSEEFVTKQINKLNVKKATGHDGISPKILKMAQQEITNPITKLVNKSIDSYQNIFLEKKPYPPFKLNGRSLRKVH
jgi:hypothetical protein